MSQDRDQVAQFAFLPRIPFWLNLIAVVMMIAGYATPATALVGVSEAAPELAPYVVMVVTRMGAASGFCGASVVAPDAVLTAAHCVAEPGNTRVHFRGEGGDPILAEVQAIVKHPGYRADAVKLRVASIDLALIRLARPLPAQFKSVTLASAAAIKPGQNFRIAGFGVTNESANEMSPILRAGRIAARLPLSRILLWANDPSGHDTGACTGDSGGPIFAPSQTTLVAVIDWAEGTSPHKCGALTQGALIVPQRAWIEGVLSSWNSSNN